MLNIKGIYIGNDLLWNCNILYKPQLEEVEEKLDEKLDVWVDSAKKKVCLKIFFVSYIILSILRA